MSKSAIPQNRSNTSNLDHDPALTINTKNLPPSENEDVQMSPEEVLVSRPGSVQSITTLDVDVPMQPIDAPIDAKEVSRHSNGVTIPAGDGASSEENSLLDDEKLQQKIQAMARLPFAVALEKLLSLVTKKADTMDEKATENGPEKRRLERTKCEAVKTGVQTQCRQGHARLVDDLVELTPPKGKGKGKGKALAPPRSLKPPKSAFLGSIVHAANTVDNKCNDWLVGPGDFHFCRDRESFATFNHITPEIVLTPPWVVVGIGTVILEVRKSPHGRQREELVLKNVFYIPEMRGNFISSNIWDGHYHVTDSIGVGSDRLARPVFYSKPFLGHHQRVVLWHNQRGRSHLSEYMARGGSPFRGLGMQLHALARAQLAPFILPPDDESTQVSHPAETAQRVGLSHVVEHHKEAQAYGDRLRVQMRAEQKPQPPFDPRMLAECRRTITFLREALGLEAIDVEDLLPEELIAKRKELEQRFENLGGVPDHYLFSVGNADNDWKSKDDPGNGYEADSDAESQKTVRESSTMLSPSMEAQMNNYLAESNARTNKRPGAPAVPPPGLSSLEQIGWMLQHPPPGLDLSEFAPLAAMLQNPSGLDFLNSSPPNVIVRNPPPGLSSRNLAPLHALSGTSPTSVVTEPVQRGKEDFEMGGAASEGERALSPSKKRKREGTVLLEHSSGAIE